MTAEVGLEDFMATCDGDPLILDVREDDEYTAGHVPGARSVPLATVPAHLPSLPSDQPVYVICATGNRSLTAARYLRRAGIDAWSVAGGTKAWQAAGRRVVTGRSST